MKSDNEQSALVQMIRPIFARDYALATGWKRVATKSQDYALFENPNADMLQLLIPQDHQASDYAERILETAEKLSQFERRDLTVVLRDMLRPNSDCLHFKRVSEGTKTGVISLLNGVGFLASIRRLLESAACGVVDPQQYFKRLQRTEAKQFLESCLLEQTGFGSYEMNVSCPLRSLTSDSAAQAHLFPDTKTAPFERRVTHYIVSASKQISDSIEADAINELVDKIGEAREQLDYQSFPVINANFCDAILDIQAVDDAGDLFLSATWAPKLPHRQDMPSEIRFRPEYVEKIEQISRQLKPPQKEQEAINVIASVEALRGDISTSGQREGFVDLLVFDKESEELVPASIYLSAADYVLADKAHMQGGYVKVRGTLVRGRRKHTIDAVQSFEIQD